MDNHNVIYMTCKFQFESDNNYVYVSIGNYDNAPQYLLFLGNFRDPAGIIRQFKKNGYIQAVCRLRWIFENNRISERFNEKFLKLSPDNYEFFKKNTKGIWLEAIKTTQLPMAQLYEPECKGFIKLTEVHHKIYHYIKFQSKFLTDENKNYKIKIIGNLDKSHSFTVYKVIDIDKNN